MSAFFDTYSDKVNRLVWRLLGADAEHNDVVNTAFVHMLSAIKGLKDAQALSNWVSTITINTVRREIRNRRYRRLFFVTAEHPEEFPTPQVGPASDVSGRVFGILKTMKTDSQIVFVLRYLEGHTFDEIAQLKGCSLATAKRQGKKCKKEFLRKAEKDTVLAEYIEELGDVR